MSHLARTLRALALASVAMFGAAAPAAHAVERSLTYTCTYPIVGDQPVKLDLDVDLSQKLPLSPLSGRYDARANLTLGDYTGVLLKTVQAATFEGTVKLKLSVRPYAGDWLAFTILLTIPSTSAAVELPPIAVRGSTPSVGFSSGAQGPATLRVDSLELLLTARDAAGVAIAETPYDESRPPESPWRVPCALRPANQETVLGTFDLGPEDPILIPFSASASAVTPTSAKLSWSSADGFGTAERYDIYVNGTQVGSVPGTARTFVLTDLSPKTGYDVFVQAAGGGAVMKSSPLRFETLDEQPVIRNYANAGSVTLKRLVTGTLPLGGTTQLTTNAAADGVTAAFTLPQTTANLVALGFLPVTAKVAFAPTEAASGTLTDGALALRLKTRIKLPQLSVLGLPLAGGSNCQTRAASTIDLQAPGFSPAAGGTLVGAFTISDLAGCGALTGLVSPLTAGSGNLIALKLSPTS